MGATSKESSSFKQIRPRICIVQASKQTAPALHFSLHSICKERRHSPPHAQKGGRKGGLQKLGMPDFHGGGGAGTPQSCMVLPWHWSVGLWAGSAALKWQFGGIFWSNWKCPRSTIPNMLMSLESKNIMGDDYLASGQTVWY